MTILIEKLSDLVKTLPSLIWLCVCISAIPSYLSISWRMPVVCAILSALISILCTYDLIRFHRRYNYMLFGEKKNNLNNKTKWSEVKFIFGSLLALICFILTFSFLAIGYQIPNPTLTKTGCSYGM